MTPAPLWLERLREKEAAKRESEALVELLAIGMSSAMLAYESVFRPGTHWNANDLAAMEVARKARALIVAGHPELRERIYGAKAA